MMSKQKCFLLLIPVIVSFAAPRRIPAPMRYENTSGDVVEIAAWDRHGAYVYVKLRPKRTGCTETFEGKADQKSGNRYVLDRTPGEMIFRVNERKVKITRVETGLPDNDVCRMYEGVYKRVQPE